MKSLSFRWQLTLFILMICGVTLSLALVGLYMYDAHQFNSFNGAWTPGTAMTMYTRHGLVNRAPTPFTVYISSRINFATSSPSVSELLYRVVATLT